MPILTASQVSLNPMIQEMDISFSAEIVCLASQEESEVLVPIMAGFHDPSILTEYNK